MLACVCVYVYACLGCRRGQGVLNFCQISKEAYDLFEGDLGQMLWSIYSLPWQFPMTSTLSYIYYLSKMRDNKIYHTR